MERTRLIVKNFGPLKDIDIEVREMVCLIGKQSSGKSTLAKLIAIFEDENFVSNKTSFDSELMKLNLSSFIRKDTFISYSSQLENLKTLNFEYSNNQAKLSSLYIRIQNLLDQKFEKSKFKELSSILDELVPIFKKANYANKDLNNLSQIAKICKDLYLRFDLLPKETISELSKIDNPPTITEISKINNNMSDLLSEFDKKPNGLFDFFLIVNRSFHLILSIIFIGLKNDSLYIPSERNFLHLISSNIQGLINNKIQIPGFLLNVGQEYEKALNNIKLVPLSLIDKKLKYKREGSTSYIYHSESEKVNLLESASGLQSVIPILLLIEFMNSNKKEYNYNFIIEEPELNLYPETQHNLIKHLVANCLDDVTRSKNLVLTTHSPYVLSSINNLLMAYKKGQEKPKEVNKIIKKKSWLNPKRFAAYEMRNGKAYSIVNKKLGLIKENMIDNVVDVFDNEFTRLLNV